MGTKNQQAVYEWVNISDDLVYEWVRFFKGKVYEWGRFRNTSSHTRTKITPKLPHPLRDCKGKTQITLPKKGDGHET